MARVNFKPKTLPTFGLTGRSALTITRQGEGSWVRGRWVEGEPEDIEIEANIQPTKYNDVLKLQEAFRTRDTRTIYSTSEIRTMREGDGGWGADTFQWKGDTYEIMFVQDWTETGVLEHYKGIGVRQELSK